MVLFRFLKGNNRFFTHYQTTADIFCGNAYSVSDAVVTVWKQKKLITPIQFYSLPKFQFFV